MSHMKRDPTLVMTGVIALILCIYAGSAYFYHINIKNFTMDLNEKTNLAEELSQQLSNYITNLNDTKEELQVKTEREEDLSLKYEDIKSEKETLEDENVGLESDLSISNNMITDLNETILLKDQQIDSLNSQVNSLETDVNNLEDNVDNLCSLATSNNLTSSIC